MKLEDGRPFQPMHMGRVVALLLAASPLRVSGLSLFANGTGSTLRGFSHGRISPVSASAVTNGHDGSSIGDTGSCSCDTCVSAYRKSPTAVSDTKCVPSMQMAMGATCNPKGKFPANTFDADVPYQVFCTCACQPFLKVDSELTVGSGPASCVDLSPDEIKMVDNPDGSSAQNCEDPKLPTQMEQNKLAAKNGNLDAKGLAKMAKEAATPAPKPAGPTLAGHTAAVLEAGKETNKQLEATIKAHETAKMLTKNPALQKAYETKS